MKTARPVTLPDLTPPDIALLTQALRPPDLPIPTNPANARLSVDTKPACPSILTHQICRQVAQLPNHVKAPIPFQPTIVSLLSRCSLIELPPSSPPLCKAHSALNTQLTHSIYLSLVRECTVRLQPLVDRFPALDDGGQLAVHELRAVQALWRPFGYRLKSGFLERWEREACEACVLMKVGGDTKVVGALMAVLESRRGRKYSKRSRRRRGLRKDGETYAGPRFKAWVEGWVAAFPAHEAQRIHSMASVVGPGLAKVREDIRQEHKREKRLARQPGKLEKTPNETGARPATVEDAEDKTDIENEIIDFYNSSSSIYARSFEDCPSLTPASSSSTSLTALAVPYPSLAKLHVRQPPSPPPSNEEYRSLRTEWHKDNARPDQHHLSPQEDDHMRQRWRDNPSPVYGYQVPSEAPYDQNVGSDRKTLFPPRLQRAASSVYSKLHPWETEANEARAKTARPINEMASRGNPRPGDDVLTCDVKEYRKSLANQVIVGDEDGKGVSDEDKEEGSLKSRGSRATQWGAFC